ncbi:MAG: hypothetical protein ABJH98_13780 [Reichenbachiella sp.]|uniref:hypothetical protein n=1 Tax=Reichenbachiella sp. TaxID=2184521 RepID=UPI003299E5B4
MTTNFIQNYDIDHHSIQILKYICLMLLRIISILLISVMMYKPILCTWTVVDFAMNRDYIAAYLCENQDQPELECQGKCFLMTKLKNQMNDSQEHKAKQLTQLSKIEVMSLHAASKFAFGNSGFISLISPDDPNTSTGYLAGIFHPPIV